MFQNKWKNNDFTYSLEVFPPKKEGDFVKAHETLDALAKLEPDFISVTYGAGGSKSKKTVELASYIQNTCQIPAIAHFTCVGNTSDQVDEICEELKSHNITNILALRGDRPKDMSDETFYHRSFTYASELIQHLKKKNDFSISAACYPEKHFESFSLQSDLIHLKEKQDVGADFFITQLFFDNDLFYHFQDKAISKGIQLPILTGIMPITSVNQLGTTVSLTGSSIPKSLADLIAKYGDSKEDMRKAGIDFAIRQIEDLKQNKVSGIHLYSMNKLATTTEIVSATK